MKKPLMVLVGESCLWWYNRQKRVEFGMRFLFLTIVMLFAIASKAEMQIDYSITNRIYTYGTVCEIGNSYSTIKFVSPVEASGVITNGSAIYKYDYRVEWEIVGAYSSNSYELNFLTVNSNDAKVVIYPLRQDADGCAVFIGEINVPNILVGEDGHCEVKWCANDPFVGRGQVKIGENSFSDVTTITVPMGWEFPVVKYDMFGGAVTIGGGVDCPAIPRAVSGDVVIPSLVEDVPVTRLDRYTMFCCTRASSIVIPESVLNICSWAVCACSGITSINIPRKVASIQECAFAACDNLTNFSVDAGNRFYSSVGGALYDNRVTHLLCVPGGLKGDFVVPATVKSIANGAFYGCGYLSSVKIPRGVENIASATFCGCSQMKSVAIPVSVTNIEKNAFTGCYELSVVYVDWGDEERVKEMLRDSEFDVSQVEFVASVPSSQDPSGGFAGATKHIFNGIVYNSDVLCGMIQIVTAKETAKGVKVSGSVILGDGKKQTVKMVTSKVSNGYLKVNTTVGKLGNLDVLIGGDGFSGTLDDMIVESADIGEDTGVMSATVKVQYFDAKIGKLKSKSYKMTGVTSGGEAVGAISLKRDVKDFEAIIKDARGTESAK